MVEDCEMEEDSGPKPDKEKETESPAEEDAGKIGEIGDVNPSLCYIVWFANAVVISEKEPQMLQVWQPKSLGEGLPERTRESHEEGRFKLKRGYGEEGRLILSEVGGYPTGHP